MSKSIAFFDFDGTLTSKDSLTEFYKYLYKRNFFYAYYLRNLALVVLVQFKIVSYFTLKKRRLKYLVKKFPTQFLKDESRDFFRIFIENELKIKAKTRILELKKRGFKIVIVSASLDLLLSNFDKELSAEIITNELEEVNGNFTGNFIRNKDCNFEEKVHRIKSKYDIEDYEEVHAYGDSKGDFAMFELAHKSFLNYFKE